ncbi:thermostable hemolysin [Massilia sp. R798]|uniref:Thermostable hemolysin n=2 Tax=Massilia soli TaxID=2792854 RepID=A0ABS7SUY5_9BURK|nr:thermostable hemolysin [Massilia soli]
MVSGASAPSARPNAVRAPRRISDGVEYVRAGDPARASLEAFIAQSFHASYGAILSHFCDTLLGCRDGSGQWIAALGYSLGEDGPLFLEQYLDAPLEQAIGARAGHPVARAEIVEVGNLAAAHPGAARALIVSMTRLLHAQGLHWVAFTATTSLLNSFTRLRLKPGVLAAADPHRLPDGGRRWGSYYNAQPQVMFGDIRYGYAQLA